MQTKLTDKELIDRFEKYMQMNLSEADRLYLECFIEFEKTLD